MSYFGEKDPRDMPEHLFSGALDLNYDTAIRANVAKQDYRVCPRYWYIDAVFECRDCRKPFVWSAKEQKLWFEEYGHYVDSQAVRCLSCRSLRRKIKGLRKEYDGLIATARNSGANDEKLRIIVIVDTIESLGLGISQRMHDSRELFRRQVYE